MLIFSYFSIDHSLNHKRLLSQLSANCPRILTVHQKIQESELDYWHASI